MIDVSSKLNLKMSCLQSANGDVDRADKLYRFISDGLESLPDFTAPKPGVVQQATQAIDSLFNWVDNNSEKFIKGYNFIQMMRGGAPVADPVPPTVPPAEIPPLPEA